LPRGDQRFESLFLHRQRVCLTGAFHGCRRKDPAFAGSVGLKETMEGLVGRLGIGGRQLARLFARYIKASPVQVAKTARVQRAKRLLDETDLPMTEIALRAGVHSLRVWGEVSGKEVEVEVRRHDKEALEIDVTRCRFAEFFRALGEPELGALLICETDFDIALVGEGEVSLDRAQTIMQGAPSCTFRYKFAPR
jgi:AraC-like DNA-binding protein